MSETIIKEKITLNNQLFMARGTEHLNWPDNKELDLISASGSATKYLCGLEYILDFVSDINV